MVEIIDAPFDLCGRHLGSRLGPVALRLENLIPQLNALGIETEVGEEACRLDHGLPKDQDETFARAMEVYTDLSRLVEQSTSAGNIPLVLGGDHSLAIGSISGALKNFGDDLAVLWIDAHMDLNTPAQSPSGNLHGMPLAALCRLRDASGPWNTLLGQIVPEKGLEDRVAWLGIRDVDAGESANYRNQPRSQAWSMQDVDRRGMKDCMQEFDKWMEKIGCSRLWVSFDVDSLDPIYAPGTGTAVRGGLTYREGHLAAEMLNESINRSGSAYKLAGIDLVETNPLQDQSNETARVAVEWILSLFGKTVLGAGGDR